MEQYLTKKQANKLIALCWLAYAVVYLGRLNYSANLVRILEEFSITKAQGGSIASFFFFAYAAGQLIHGLLNKYYNPRWMIAGSLIFSAAMNFIMPLCGSADIMKWVWMVNGFTQAVLWSTLTRVLGMYLSEAQMKRSIIVMGTTTAGGTFFSYAFSALITDWTVSFYFATVALTIVGIVWFVGYGRVTKNACTYMVTSVTKEKTARKMNASFVVLFSLILLFAVINNLIKDGLNTWTPTVFYELFKMPDSLSIFLTMGLPILSILGSTVCVAINKYIKDHVLLCGTFFIVAFVMILVLIVFLPFKLWWLTLIVFAISALMMSAINNVITSLMPLQLRDVADPGRISGITNAFCYVGSTVSTYALGALADSTGWNGVFFLMFFVTGGAVIISMVYWTFRRVLCK